MNRKIFFATAIIIALMAFGFRYASKKYIIEPQLVSRESIFRNKIMIQCSPDWNHNLISKNTFSGNKLWLNDIFFGGIPETNCR